MVFGLFIGLNNDEIIKNYTPANGNMPKIKVLVAHADVQFALPIHPLNNEIHNWDLFSLKTWNWSLYGTEEKAQNTQAGCMKCGISKRLFLHLGSSRNLDLVAPVYVGRE